MNSPLPPLYLAPINHVLRQNSWALERLKPFAGKVVRADCFPVSMRLAISASGDVTAAPPALTPDVTIRLTPGHLLRLGARDATVWNDIAVDGDPQLAAVLNGIAHNLRWDIEEDLNRVVGDIAAHRLVDSARKVDHWGRQGADNLARSFTEYWTEERPLIAGRADLEQFNRDVDVLRDDLARLEKRIEKREG